MLIYQLRPNQVSIDVPGLCSYATVAVPAVPGLISREGSISHGFSLSLDVQILSQKMFSVYFEGPNTFPGGVWMSRVCFVSQDVTNPLKDPR